MKFDMGGSAAVLGAAKALGQIKPLGVEVSHLSHWSFNFSISCQDLLRDYQVM